MQKAKIVSLVSDQALLEFEDGQKIRVPVSSIEGTPKDGQEIAVIFAALGTEDAGRQKLAQHLLNELLGA